MHTINIRSYNASCNVLSNSEGLLEAICNPANLLFFRRVIPSFSLGNDSSYPDVTLEVNEIPDCTFRMIEDYPNFQMNGERIYFNELVSTSEYLLERARQEKRIYNLHSSVLSKGENCAVIHGASKSGKTVLSLEGSLNYGLNFLNNERTLIDLREQKVVGGYTSVVLEGHHKEMFPELKETEVLEIGKNSHLPHKIRLFIMPIIDSGMDELIIKQISKEDAKWHLYPEFTKRIRGINKMMNGFTYPLDSLDSKKIAMQRMGDLINFLDNLPIYSVRGSKESIVKFIDSKL